MPHIYRVDTMLALLTSQHFRDAPNVGPSMLIRYLAVTIAASILATTATAQTAAEHIAAGDKDAVALNATGALAEYKAAIASDSTVEEAYWKASRTLVDLGEYEPDRSEERRVGKECRSR